MSDEDKETDKKVVISAEEMAALKKSQEKLALALNQAEKAIQAHTIAKLEYENLVLGVYMKYKLDSDHVIDEQTGTVSKKEENEVKS